MMNCLKGFRQGQTSKKQTTRNKPDSRYARRQKYDFTSGSYGQVKLKRAQGGCLGTKSRRKT